MSKAQQGSTIECFALRKSIRGKYHVTITSILLLYLITLYVRLTYLSFPTCSWLWWLGSQLFKNSIQYQCLQHLFGSEKVSRTLHSLVQRLVTLCEHNPGKTLKLQDVTFLAIFLWGDLFSDYFNILFLYPFYSLTSVTFANNIGFYFSVCGLVFVLFCFAYIFQQ